ncbi:MAG: hypothetical protein EOP81_02360 [Variovorax sp.]|nr:MAG: hypothetical protein EOP81_02360 [Variovorax sp.]
MANFLIFHSRKSPHAAGAIAEVRIVSKDAVKRANARIMAGSALSDPFERHNIPRPTREEIERAGSKALRDLRTRDSKVLAG